MAGLGDLFITIGAKLDGFRDAMGDIPGILEKTASTMQSAGFAMTAAITTPLIGIAAAALNAGMVFDEVADTIRTGTGATGSALESLKASFSTVFTTVPVSAGAASAAIADLNTRLGITGKPLEELATQLLNLARITGSEVGPLIASSTRLFGDWSISTDKQAATLDYLFKVTQSTGIGITRLTELVVQFGAPLRALGFSLEEGAALLGKWEKEGVNLETVLSGLRFALGNFAKAGLEPKAALEGIIGAIKGAKTESEATALAFQTFGKRAAVDMSRAIIEGRFTIDDFVKSLQASKETINTATKDTDDFSQSWVLFKNKLTAALEPLGTTLMAAIGNLLDKSQPVLNFINGMVSGFNSLSPTMQTVVLAFGGMVATIGPILVAIGTFGMMISGITTALGLLAPLLPLIGAGFTAMMGPVGLAVLALSALGSIAYVIYRDWDIVSRGLIGIWEKLTGAADTVGWSLPKLTKGMYDLSAAEQEAQKYAEDVTGKLGDQTKVIIGQTKAYAPLVDAKKEAKKASEALAAAFGELGLKTKEGKTKLESMGDALKLVEKEWKAGRVSITAYNNAVKNFNEEGKKSQIATLKKELEDVTKVYKDGGITLDTYTVSHRRLTAEIEKLDPSLKLVKVSVKDLDEELAKLDIEMGAYSVEAANAALKSNSVAVALGSIKGPVDDYYDSLKKAGITSHETFNQMAADAEHAYEAIAADSRATAWEKDNAMLRMLKAQAEAMRANSVQIPADMQRAMEDLEDAVNDTAPQVRGRFEDLFVDLRGIVGGFVRAVSGTLIDALWGNENNAQLDKQAEDVRKSLTERAGDYEAFQALIALQLSEARQNSAAEQEKDLAQLRDNLAEKQEAYDEYVTGSSEDLDGVRKERAESLAKELADLREKLSDKQAAYDEYSIDVAEKIQRLTDDDAESLADQLDNLKDSLRDKSQSYEDFVQDVNTDLSRIGEDLQDDLQDKGTSTKRNIDDKNKDFDRDERDTLERIERLKKAGKKETGDEIKDLRKALARKKEDRDEYNRRQIEDLNDYTKDHQRAAERQRTDLQTNLAQRTRDYKEFVTENAANAIDVTVKHKEALARQVGDLRASLAERAKDLAAFDAATALKAEELTTISATKLAAEENAIIASLARKTAEHEKYKVGIGLKEEEIRVLAAEKLAGKEQDLVASLAKETADYEKYKSDVAAQLQEIKDLHTTVWGDIANMLIGKGGLFAQIADAFVVTLITPITDAISGFLEGSLKSLGRGLGEIFGIGAGAVGDIAGGVLGTIGGAGESAGSVAGSAAGAAGNSASAIVGAVAGVASAVSGIIGNFQFMGMNKSLDLIVLHTLQTANDLANLRRDAWDREKHLFEKLDDWRAYLQLQMDSLIQSVRSGGDWLFEVTQALQMQQLSLDTMVAGGATGNITFDLRGAYFLNDRAVDEFMETVVRRMKARNA